MSAWAYDENGWPSGFGNRIAGIFTDEPQLSGCGIPWSFVLPDEYKKELPFLDKY